MKEYRKNMISLNVLKLVKTFLQKIKYILDYQDSIFCTKIKTLSFIFLLIFEMKEPLKSTVD